MKEQPANRVGKRKGWTRARIEVRINLLTTVREKTKKEAGKRRDREKRKSIERMNCRGGRGASMNC